jgi:hypothetical protein
MTLLITGIRLPMYRFLHNRKEIVEGSRLDLIDPSPCNMDDSAYGRSDVPYLPKHKEILVDSCLGLNNRSSVAD